MSELLNCPFCGHKAIQELDINNLYSVECINCTAEINSCNTKEEAINTWNTRQPPKGLTEDEIMSIIVKEGFAQDEDYYLVNEKTLAKAISKAITNKKGINKWDI